MEQQVINGLARAVVMSKEAILKWYDDPKVQKDFAEWLERRKNHGQENTGRKERDGMEDF